MERKKLIDVIPEYLTGGIFDALQEFDVPWKDEEIENILDVEYFGNISGDKFISPLIAKLLSGPTLSAADLTLLASVIMAMNGVNWAKEYATLSAEYNPLENYSMTEQLRDDVTTDDFGHTVTRTNNLADGTSSAVYGFNSATAVNSGSVSGTNTGTVSDVNGGEDTRTREYDLTRSGNIGVTTSQQMLQSERDLWRWNFFYNVVFPDVDKILTLRVY